MVEEELDETIYWLEIIILLEFLPAKLLGDLLKEGNELFLIITRAIKTSKENEEKEKYRKQETKSVNP